MNFTISPTVFENYPNLAIGVIVVKNADNSGSFPEVTEMLRSEEARIRNTIDLETFREHPNLAALQEAHRKFGSNPNKFAPSAQALVKRVLKGGQLPSINPLVDIYNVISMRYVVCAGAEDTDKCEGDIRLDYADGTESFALIGTDEEDPPDEGELVYKDDRGVICRKLNWREGDRTRTDEGTKNAVVVIEGFPPFTRGDLDKALDEVSEMLEKYCGAGVRVEVLDKDNSELQINP
ncbi:hypothetical protein KJ652_04775 [Patescibacteria group bacterium]|nr:hypothetical protein [Patescibacteria group bacterium]MBU1123879.1 hypothetical protein [Patescibacteria group bacterium]MBU1910985.1 hypothetical protein [Patescibacteria group bacterium]